MFEAGFAVASVLRGQHRPAHTFVVCDQAVLFDAGLLAVAGGLEGDDAAPETQLAGKRREAALTAPAAARWTGVSSAGATPASWLPAPLAAVRVSVARRRIF